jgi:hypothetical protein
VVIWQPPWNRQHAPVNCGQVLGLQVPPRVHTPGGGHCDATVVKHEPSGRQHLPTHGFGVQEVWVGRNVPPDCTHLAWLVMMHWPFGRQHARRQISGAHTVPTPRNTPGAGQPAALVMKHKPLGRQHAPSGGGHGFGTHTVP